MKDDIEETCPRCRLPRAEWGGTTEGYPSVDQRYCCRGCAENTGCTCLEAGAAA